MKVTIDEYPQLTEEIVQLALADSEQWWNVLVVPNWRFYHDMDIAVLTRAGYLWEYEIKLTQADWDRDNRKDVVKGPHHWQQATRNLEYVKRFYYVYAAGLTCPDWVPEFCGLVEVRHHANGKGTADVLFRPIRRAKDRPVKRLPEKVHEAMWRSVYHRFWGSLKKLPVREQAEAIK